MMMGEMPASSLFRRRSSERKKVQFNRMFEPQLNPMATGTEDAEFIPKTIFEDETSIEMISQVIARPTIHWGPVVEGDFNSKEHINTDTEHFDALFARSNGSSSPPSHPRCYSSCSPFTAPSLLAATPSVNLHAKSQPLLSSPVCPLKVKQITDSNNDIPSRQSTGSSTASLKNGSSSSSSARIKRKNFSLTHTAQTFLQASNSQTEQLEPLARSCSYKRPQSMKKYRQKKKEKEQPLSLSARQSSTIATHIPSSIIADSARKSLVAAPVRISTNDLMTTDDPHEQWSNLKIQRAARIGSLPLDQLQLPGEGGEEIYLVRQFHTTSKGFVNRGDSFKRSFKRSGSISRRSSFRTNPNLTTTDRTPSQEHDVNHSSLANKEVRNSSNSLTNSSGPNLNGILDSHFIENNPLASSAAIPLQDHQEGDDDDDDDENPIVERIQTVDGLVQDIRVYQVYLLGMSGTGKCSLIRQFKSTEYRGIYDYSSSIDDDPDNTVSIMLDGIESRLHIITIDIDLIKSNVIGDAYVVVYSITDRQSFQTALQLIKNIREQELIDHQPIIKRHVPIILVGNKSDLVRKRSVTKESEERNFQMNRTRIEDILAARHAAFKHDCKFVETSAAINDKVDDLLAGTLKQIRISEQIRNEQRRRLTVANASVDTNDSETAILTSTSSRKASTVNNRNPKSMFAKFLNVFRRKPSRLPADVENLNTGVR